MKALYNIIRFIFSHPLARKNKGEAFKRFFLYQLGKIFIPYPIVYPFTDKTKLIIERGMTGATGNIYCGLHEFEDMGFLLHFLRPEDLFVDVGANVGSYTILASAHVGCDTIAIEPIPATFEKLKNNILINHIDHKVKALNIGAGSKNGVLHFTEGLDTVNHVAIKEETFTTTEVVVESLDQIVHERYPVLIKVDVEGFEKEVLDGATRLLANNNLQAIIIELNGSGKKYGFKDSEIHQKIIEIGYEPYKYDPFKRKLTRLDTFGLFNTLYIRDFESVLVKVQDAQTFTSMGILV